MITIRKEGPEDVKQIRRIHVSAFDTSTEADIVDQLRRSADPILSLVAEEVRHGGGQRIVGHLLFSPVAVDGPQDPPAGMGLAPMAVLPEYQEKGIGSALVRHGLDILAEGHCPFIIVLGHPEYYPRFGFEPASRHGLHCQWKSVPDAAFMVKILDGDRMAGVGGVVRYHDLFDAAL
ncbi:MAG: N-acetyltransferase [Desulfosarcinaceae bacterium]|nr:N-acetyltransferase [Desulfosarcinaceae bacterium]